MNSLAAAEQQPESGTEMVGRARSAVSYTKRHKVLPVSREQEEIRASAYALRCIASLVDEGLAQMEHVAHGQIELRLATGEVYRVGENTLRRIF
jgi:hypothetical protein